MGKYIFGDGQYIVYARDEQEARLVASQELKRIDAIKQKMANLLTENGEVWKNFMDNSSEERLNIHFNDRQSAIYDKDSTAKGEVRLQRDSNNDAILDKDGNFKYELAYRYPEIDGHDANFRLAHEMGHLMLNALNTQRQGYDKETNSRQVSGLIRRDETTQQFYGEQMQENAINLIAQLAIREENKADDIISGKIDLSEFNSYKRCDDLVKLLAVSMRNDFDKEMSFEQLANQKLDSMITRSDGKQVPANTFFYGVLNDSSMIEKEFDKYLGKGAWRDVNDAFSELYKSNISKERFELIFENTQGLIQEFANLRYQEKYKEAFIRNGGANIPDLSNKLKLLQEMIKPEKNISQVQNRTDESINNSDKTASKTKVEIQSNGLSLKQRVARFLQKNNLFMNLSFVENFVHQQLDVLPGPIQGKRTSNDVQAFEDWITGNGEYKKLPPIQRMSDPQKIEKMQRKMRQVEKDDDGIGR